MKMHQLAEAKATSQSPKVQLLNELTIAFGMKPIKWPKLDADLREAALEEAVEHWNASSSRYISYPFSGDLSLFNKAASIMGKLGKLTSRQHLHPITKKYYAAVLAVIEAGAEAEGYGKLVGELISYLDMFNLTATRTDSFKKDDHQAFAKAGLKKLGASVDASRYTK